MVDHAMVPLYMHGIYFEGNMASISPTVMIEISRIPGKIENVYIDADCSCWRNFYFWHTSSVGVTLVQWELTD
jgi:hypothetical protein